MDQYYLSNSPEKFLMTQHFHSSLQQPNLENVEANLYAARQKNHQLAMKYFQAKYGSTSAYQQFAKTHNLGKANQVKSQSQSLQQHLQRKARQIQMSERQKFHNRKYNINNSEQNNDAILQVDETVGYQHNYGGKRVNASKNNPWVNTKDKKQTQQNNTKDCLQLGRHMIIDSVKNNQQHRQNQFISQFKNYLINRSKDNTLDNNSNVIDNLSLTKSGFGAASAIHKNQSKLAAKNKDKSPDKKIRCYEEELAKKIFKQIAGEHRDNTKVEKITLIQYLVKNSKIIRVLGLTEKQLNNQLMNTQETKQQTQITFQQFLFFILKTVGKDAQINLMKQQKRQKSVPQGCLLKKDIIMHFQSIFKQLDTHTDLIVKRLQYTNRLVNDPLVKKRIDQPAVYEQNIDKYVSLRRILQRLQLQAILGTQQEQKVRQYISWNQFLNHFKSNQSKKVNYNLLLLVNSLSKQQKFGLLQLSDNIIHIISQSIKKQNKGLQYFSTFDLIEQISRHSQFDHEKYSLARQQSTITNLPSQTLQQTLIRIKNSASQYVTIKQFMEYFSTKGKPTQDFNQDFNFQSKKGFSSTKIKIAEQSLASKQNKQNLDGYDSDPQMYSSNVHANSPRRTGRSAKKLSDMGAGNSKQIISQQTQNQAKIVNKQFKVTIPVPFSFENRQNNKPKKQLSVVSQMQFEQFRAKPIPAKVKDQSLYERMLEEDQRRIQERRKNNMIITLANQKPFSFVNRKTNKKTKQERQQYQFKAKPIPWFCSVDLLQKKKEAQMSRNQKIAKQAQQSLAKAKLPPRMQRDYQQKLAKKGQTMIDYSKKEKKNSSYRDPPDFDRLHRKFEQGMQRKRKQNKVTHPQQFNFNSRSDSIRPKTSTNFLNQTNALQSLIKAGDTDYRKCLQPKVVASTTIKYTQQVEKRRKQQQQKRAKQVQKRKQEEQRNKIDIELQKKVQALAKNKQNKEEQERQKRQQENQQQNKKHAQWKKQRIQKGRQQPMLVQRPLKRDQKIEKMKKLFHISKVLKDNGIKGKEHDSHFKKEELLLLQDWQQLKDRIK